jgi:hypothetical protein
VSALALPCLCSSLAKYAFPEGDAFLLAKVRQPIPREHTFDADDQLLALGRDDPQKRVGSRRQILMNEFRAVLIENADIHRPCM